MRIQPTKTDLWFAVLTTEEEENFARWIMDLLSKKWFDSNSGSFYKLVRRIYWIKCAYGKDIPGPALLELVDFVTKSNHETEMADIPEEIREKWRIPDIPIDAENDQGRTALLMDGAGAKYTTEERIRLYLQETRNIWRGIWREHRALQRSSDDFLVFPGDDPGEGHRQVQEEKERRFWAEVETRRAEWEVSRSEAERLVADYMPRGDMSDVDRKQFEPKKGLRDSMEIPEIEEEADGDFFDYHFPEGDPEADQF